MQYRIYLKGYHRAGKSETKRLAPRPAWHDERRGEDERRRQFALAWTMRGVIGDRRRMHAYHIARTYLPHLLLLASSHRPAHYRYGGSPFPISPDPLLPVLSCLPASNVPPPPGRGMRQFSSVRTMRATTQSARFQSSRPLTHDVRSLSARCLLATRRATERRAERETKTRNWTIDGTRNGTS